MTLFGHGLGLCVVLFVNSFGLWYFRLFLYIFFQIALEDTCKYLALFGVNKKICQLDKN